MRKTVLVVIGLVASLGLVVESEAKGGKFEASLVRCADVTAPAPLAGCGTDPLVKGEVSVSKSGDLKVVVAGALPNETYDVVLRALDGTPDLSLGAVVTDGNGKGDVVRSNLFDLDQAGPGSFLVMRAGAVQFVPGVRAEEDVEAKANLVPCAALNLPEAPAGCGTDTLGEGAVSLEQGELEVQLKGAPADATYDVLIRGLGGAELPLGPLTTDRRGKGRLELEDVLDAAAVVAGNVILRRDGADQFVSGFQSTRRRPAHVARFTADMVRCAEVNVLAPLTGCGPDLFRKGHVTIDEKGDVKAQLHGAVPEVAYEVFFVSFDASAETLIGTLTTNPAGNGQMVVRDFFAVGDRGAGNIVIKRDGLDQFVTGFHVVR